MNKPELFLLHFAGGNAYSYNFLLPYLHQFNVFQIELPGRGKRAKEKLLTEFNLAAEDVFQQVLMKNTNPKYLIYGHSMGSYLGLRVTSMLGKIRRNPVGLIVSGNPGPGIKEPKYRYLFKQADFIEELKKLGGIPEEIFENKESFEFFEPILRADFELAERNNMAEQKPINVPIVALMGNQEKDVATIDNWKRFTNEAFESRVLSGDHFFIYKHPQQIAEIIQNCYDRVTALQY